jgi:zinc-ribbon domain
MRCKNCGNQNPEDHRFCGMCGRALVDPPKPAPAPQPALRIDPDAGGRKPLLLDEPVRARDVSYLLDEAEEEEQPRSLGRTLLLVFGLALIGGFGYMYFLSGAGGPLNKEASPAVAAAPASPVGGVASATPPAPVPVPEKKPQLTSSEVPKSTAATPDAASPAAGTTPAVKKPAPDPEASAPPAAKAAATPSITPVHSTPVHTNVPAAVAPPKPVQKPAPKPSADLVAQAEKLVYGDGVPQDCDRGLGAMRPLAATADPRAMIALGALYTTGTCVPRDLPTAYSWYARALHKTPDNLTLQQDMKQIWGQMTAPERQLAIRLSQ